MDSELFWDQNYFDRPEIQSVLKKRFQSFSDGYRQNVALLGREYSGKSLLLRKILSDEPPSNLIPVYVELHREPFEYFAQRFMGALLFGLLKSKGRSISGDFTELLNRARRYIPKALNRMRLIKRLLKKERLKESYGSLLSLPRVISEETGSKILLILDEFDRLKDFPVGDPFKELGTELMMQKDTLFVVSSSNTNEARGILKGKLSLLFGNFEILDMKSLSFQESTQFIHRSLDELPIKETMVKFLIQLTDGHPYYLDVILERLRSLALLKDQNITENLFVQALTQELYSENGRLYRFFSHKIEMLQQGKVSFLYLTALLGIAIGKRRVRELSRYLERTQSETKKILNRLVEKEVLIRSGSFHTLSDPLFIFWLRFVFEVQKRDLGMRTKAALEKFKTNLFEVYDEFVEEDKKELSKRVEELLRQFVREDVVEVSGKRIHFQDFGEMSLRHSPSGRLTSLLAKSGHNRWMYQIAEKSVGEEEVGEFLELVDRYKKPIKNRILVALSGIELNAKLLAQESRIHIWDLKNINFLLDLFGKSKIIPSE